MYLVRVCATMDLGVRGADCCDPNWCSSNTRAQTVCRRTVEACPADRSRLAKSARSPGSVLRRSKSVDSQTIQIQIWYRRSRSPGLGPAIPSLIDPERPLLEFSRHIASQSSVHHGHADVFVVTGLGLGCGCEDGGFESIALFEVGG